MSKVLLCASCLLVFLIPAGCSRDERPTAPVAPATVLSLDHAACDLIAGEMVLTCGWNFDAGVELPAGLEALLGKTVPGTILDFQREVIVGDIVHYSVVVAVGSGEHDVIGLHRVVREVAPFRPIRTREALFLVHGMGKDFVGNFLPGRKSALLPDDFGFAVFMAQQDIDVWGIDNSYTLVPVGPVDFGFAAGWGMDKSVADIGTGLAVARTVRLFTGNGLRKMVLVGYSQGAIMGYAYLNGEARLPRGLRSVAAFVPVDWGLGYDDPEIQQGECEFLGGYVDLYNEGVYGFYDDPDGFLASVGQLAQAEPGEPSPYYEGFTNLEVFLFFTAVPTPPNTVHYWAGTFDGDGWPLDFTHTTPLMATEFWLNWAPMHPPTHLWADFYAINCEDSVWETNLGALALPVLSVEAAGGAGPLMAGTLERLSSARVTRHTVRLLDPADAWADFGHVDLFTAGNAPDLAWQPLLTWVRGLAGNGTQDPPGPQAALGAAKAAALGSCAMVPPALGRYFGATAESDRALQAPGRAPDTASLARSPRVRGAVPRR